MKKKLKHNHLAEGEVTGHYHAAIGEGVELYKNEAGNISFEAPHGATVTHQEHNNIEIPAGNWETGIVQEYDHMAEEAREVQD